MFLQNFVHPGIADIQKITMILHRDSLIIELGMFCPVILHLNSQIPDNLIALLKITEQIYIQITAFPMLRTGIHLSQAEAFEQHHPNPLPGKHLGKLFQYQTLPAVNLPDVPDAQLPANLQRPRNAQARFLLPCNVPAGESLAGETLAGESFAH